MNMPNVSEYACRTIPISLNASPLLCRCRPTSNGILRRQLYEKPVCSAIADAQQCCFALASMLCLLGWFHAEVVVNSWKVWPGAIFLTQRPSLLSVADIGSQQSTVCWRMLKCLPDLQVPSAPLQATWTEFSTDSPLCFLNLIECFSYVQIIHKSGIRNPSVCLWPGRSAGRRLLNYWLSFGMHLGISWCNFGILNLRLETPLGIWLAQPQVYESLMICSEEVTDEKESAQLHGTSSVFSLDFFFRFLVVCQNYPNYRYYREIIIDFRWRFLKWWFAKMIQIDHICCLLMPFFATFVPGSVHETTVSPAAFKMPPLRSSWKLKWTSNH